MSITSRVWELVTDMVHPITKETLLTREKIEEVIENHSSIKETAYILHDKDRFVDEDIAKDKSGEKVLGELKPSHFHVVMRFDRAQDVESLSKWFGISENFFQRKKGQHAFADAVIYLSHESAKEQKKGKYLYPDDEIICYLDGELSFREFVDNVSKNIEKYGTKYLSKKDKLRYDVLYNGQTIRDLKRNHKLDYNKDIEALNKRRGEFLRDAPMPDFRFNIYVSGSGGAGKGLISEALARILIDASPETTPDEEVFCFVGSESVGFECYDGQPVLIWDDCRHNELFNKLGDRGNIFNVFDTKPKRIPQKKKYSMTNLVNEINIVNSVESISQFLEGLAGKYKDRYTGEWIEAEDSQKSQSYRRFPICIEVFSDYYNLQICEGYFDRRKSMLSTTKIRHIKAPLREMKIKCGSDDQKYYELCKKALEPITELYQKAIKLYATYENAESDCAFEDIGQNDEYEEFLKKYGTDLYKCATDIFFDKGFDCVTGVIYQKFCEEKHITDDKTINFVIEEIDNIRKELQ